jgi:hypothetical protein
VIRHQLLRIPSNGHTLLGGIARRKDALELVVSTVPSAACRDAGAGSVKQTEGACGCFFPDAAARYKQSSREGSRGRRGASKQHAHRSQSMPMVVVVVRVDVVPRTETPAWDSARSLCSPAPPLQQLPPWPACRAWPAARVEWLSGDVQAVQGCN